MSRMGMQQNGLTCVPPSDLRPFASLRALQRALDLRTTRSNRLRKS
jgi:hypothetical protein